MAYLHQHHHRNLHKMHGAFGNVVARDPQRSATNTNAKDSSRSTTADNVSSNSKTNVAESPVSTFLSVVLVTASPTFTDEVAGYTTLTPNAEESSAQPSPTYVVGQPQNIGSSSSEYIFTPAGSSAAPPVETATQAPASTTWEAATTYVPSTTNTPSVVVDSSSAGPSSAIPTSITMAVSSSTLLSSYVANSRMPSRSLSSLIPQSTASAAASSSAGMTSGGKAGLAIGIILIIALVAGGVLWLYWKKKKGRGEWHKTDDEKAGFGGAAAFLGSKKPAVTGSEKHDSSAPRLSLRPVTQFIPDLAAAKKRLSQGNPLDKMNKPAGMAAAGAGRSLTPNNPNGSHWERPAGGTMAANPFKDPVNPFGDQANAPTPPNVTVTPPMSESGSSIDAGTGVAVGAAATGVAGAAIMAAAAKNANGQSRNGRGSPPVGSVAAGGAPPGNVHRVQLDFKPSMEDELELNAGQLVRLLHEYDDGWALCVRLDRSQQGVAPRTCLSPRPVKPRPNGPPRMGPNGRPMSPGNGSPRPGPNGRPMSPAHGLGPRPDSPAGHHGPRPGTSNSNHAPSRPGTANSNRPFSPPSPSQLPTMPQGSNQMSPGQFNQAPRPLSPGPVTRGPNPQQPKRSQSPGPYGAGSGPARMTASQQRRRSNSASAVQARRNSPPGSSPLAREEPMPGWKPPRPQNNPRPETGVAF